MRTTLLEAKLSLVRWLQCTLNTWFLSDVVKYFSLLPILRGFGQGIRQFRDLLVNLVLLLNR